MKMETINKILELNELAKENVPEKKRFAFKKIFSKKGRPFVGITGLRGVGKTVMLRQFLKKEEKALYLSLDSISLDSLFETIKYFYKERKYEIFLLDEIHNLPNWEKELKKVYDFLPVKVFFTSSVSLQLVKLSADLSRRTILFPVPPFSVREYLYFSRGIEEKKLEFQDIIKEKGEHLAKYDFLFEEYIGGNLLPAKFFEKEEGIFRSIANTIIERDLPVAEDLSIADIQGIKKALSFIASSPVEDISYSSVSKNTGITKYKAEKYLRILEKSFLISIIEPKGSNVLKEPKILFTPPFRKFFSKTENYREGEKREEFFILSLKSSKIPVFYLKGLRGEKTPDYLVEFNNKKYVFEIGGPGKTFKQFKGISFKAERYIVSYPAVLSKGRVPLISFGFLY